MQQLLTAQTRLPGFHGEWEDKANCGDHVTFLRNGTNSRGRTHANFGRSSEISALRRLLCTLAWQTQLIDPQRNVSQASRQSRANIPSAVAQTVTSCSFADASEDLAGRSCKSAGDHAELPSTEICPRTVHTIAASGHTTQSVLADRSFKSPTTSEVLPHVFRHSMRDDLLQGTTRCNATNRAHIAMYRALSAYASVEEQNRHRRRPLRHRRRNRRARSPPWTRLATSSRA